MRNLRLSHALKRGTPAEHLPSRLHSCAWRALPCGVLLLATAALASEAKRGPWAELQSTPASMPATRPQPAQPHACQPESYIPCEMPYQPVDAQGTPARLYELATGEQMNINGWDKENAKIRKLLEPFSLTYYMFGCASEFSYVLDVSHSGKRHALYQHVLGFEAYPAQPVLFLAQSERKGSSYQSLIGLVDLGNLKSSISLSCRSQRR